MRLASTGNVGIGTTSPSAKLQVNGGVLLGSTYTQPTGSSWTTSNSQLILGGAHNAEFNTSGVKLLISGYNNDGSVAVYPIFAQDENGNDDFWIRNRLTDTTLPRAYFAGDVGIGTTTPQAKLDVVGSGKFLSGTGSNFLDIGRNDNEKVTVLVDDINVKFTAIQDQDSDSAHSFILNRVFQGAGANDFDIQKDGSSQLRIDTNGNVGIGTTSPGAKLHIGPNSLVSGYTPDRSTLAISDITNGGQLIIRGQSPRIWFDGTAGGNAELFLDNSKLNILSGDPTALGSSRLYIKEDGKVGIGTTSPIGRLNVVNGTSGQTYSNVSGVLIDVNGSSNSYYGLRVGSSTGNDHFCVTNAGNVGIGNGGPSEKLEVSGNVKMAETSATTDTDKFVVLDSGVLKYRTGAEVLADIGAQPSIVAPNAPTNLTTTIVNSTINVTFTASTTSGIDYYLVFSSVDGGDYGLISVIPPADFGATMSIIDDSFDATGTQAYRVYAVKNGVYSSPLTGNKSYSVTTPLEPTNMSVVNLNTAYYVQWDPPSANTRFVTAYNVYKHENATQASLSRSSATLVYSGMNTSYMYQISGANNGNFHQFWVETTIA